MKAIQIYAGVQTGSIKNNEDFVKIEDKEKLRQKVIQLEKLLMTLSSKYSFSTEDHNSCYDRIGNILDEI